MTVQLARARSRARTALPDRATVEARLAERGIPFRRLSVGPDASVVVSSYGSRVYGPFFGAGASQSWLPDAFGSADAFARLHESGAWNVGGDRVWIGPEIEYMIPERERYWDTYAMPASIDPGTHVISGPPDEVVMHRHARLASFVSAPGVHTSVDLTLRVRPAPDPLRGVAPLPAGVDFAGYATEITLSQTAGGSAVVAPAESWILPQVIAGGTALVPGARSMRVTDYYEPVDCLLRRVPGGASVGITGADRFKIGFAAPHVTGRLGYLRALEEDRAVLFVRASPVHPGLEYTEEPDVVPGHRGDALHIYNDDGGLGGFAEMEARGTPASSSVAAAGTERPVTDRFASWWFRGPVEAIHDIADQLVHIDPRPLPEARREATA